jgi:hypothetical protein
MFRTFALTLYLMGLNPATFSAVHPSAVSRSIPRPHITILASNPGSECSGAALTTDQGGAVTFGRALAAYCTKADGTLVSVSSGSPRVSNAGIQIEGSRTNLIEESKTLNTTWAPTNVTVTANDQTDPLGTTTAEKLESTANGGYLQSDVFVPSQTTGTLSLYVKDISTTDFDVVVRDTTAGADRTTCDLATSGTMARYTCAVTGLTGANNHVVRIYPGGTALTGSAAVWGVQFEVPTSTLGSSAIDTTTAAVTRPNETATFANGTDISTRGCMSATVTFPSIGINSGGGSILSNGTESMMGYSSATAMRINDGTNTVTANVSSVLGRTIAMKVWWSGTSMGITADGVTSTGTFDGAFSSTATLRIGATAAGSGYAYATIDNIKVGAHPNSCD